MCKRITITLSMVLFATAGLATSVAAQEKTREEVRQELVEAENNGLRFVTDTSYPEVNPSFEQQAERLKQQSAGSFGTGMSGSGEAGLAIAARSGMSPASCVGPVSFCSLYFGN